jgi:hypothetical protein
VRPDLEPARYPVCSGCGERHSPTLPTPSAWSTSLLPDLGRSAPLGRGQVDDTALQRDRFNPWREP